MKKLRLFIMMLMAAMLPLAVQAQQALPYSYGFEDNDLSADGWTMVDCTVGSYSSTGIIEDAAMNGDYGFMFYYNTNPPQYLISPELTGTEDGVAVSFYYVNGSTWTETFQVGYSTTDNDVNNFVWGEEYVAPGDWTSYSHVFPAGTKYVAVKYTANDQFKMYLDDFTFEVPPACITPAITSINVTATSVTIGWTDYNATTPASWTLEFDGTEITGITENPYTHSGLTAATEYTIKVKAICNSTDESDWSNEMSFTTLCEAIVVTETDPFHEDFEGEIDCWSIENISGGVNWTVAEDEDYAYEGSHFIYAPYQPGSSSRLSTPVLDLTALTAPMLTFQHKQPDYLGVVDELAVYYRSNPTDAWTLLANYTTAVEEYTMESFVLPNPSAAYQVAFVSTGNDGNNVFLDDIYVEEAPSCITPAGLTLAAVSATTATISWTDQNTTAPQSWTIEFDGVDTVVTENPFTFDELTAATEYTVRVKANCTDDSESDWTTELTFSTDCEVIVVTPATPYQEGFENDAECWRLEQLAGTEAWYFSENTSAVEGGSMAVFPYNPGSQCRLSSPTFDLTQLTSPYLTFYHHQAPYNSIVDDLSVYYRTSNTEEWTLLAEFTTPYSDWTEEAFVLPNPSATYQIAFVGSGNDGNYIWLDDINIMEEPTCFAPTALTFEDITTTTATIGWTDNNETTPQSWTININGVDTVVTENPFTFDNLTAATGYTVMVAANCSADDQSQWSDELTFTTACDAITIDDQFSEDFSGYTATSYNELGVMPTCWDAIAAATYGPHVYAGSYGPNGSTDNALIFTSGSSSTYGSPNLAVLPEFTNDLQGYTLSFKAKLESSYAPGVLTYGYITGVDQTTFNAIDTVAASTTAQDFEYTLPSIPAGTRLAFCYSNSNIYYCCAIDDVVIFFSEETDSCATPTNVVVNNNVVTWTGDAANYNVQVTVAGEVVIDTTVATTTFTVEGLENNTHASVAVQAVCAEDDLSDWSEAVEFDYTNGINNYSLKANIYPNPTTGNVTVESDAINADITVFDAFGKLMMTSKVATERTELNFSEFAPGVYMVRIANTTAITTIKVVKK